MIKYFYDIFPLTIYLAFQRLFPKSKSPEVRLMPKLAFWSIAIGVSASVLILSITNGLHEKYLGQLADQEAHITIVSAGRGVPAYQELINNIKNQSGVIKVFPYYKNEALLQSYGESTGIILSSFPENFTNDMVFTNTFRLLEGKWGIANPRTITVGEGLAKNFSLFIGDSIDILVYDKILGAITYRFRIGGIFSASDAILSTGVGFISLSDSEELFGSKGYTQYIGIRVANYNKVEQYVKQLKPIIPFRIKTWRSSNLNTILAIQNEKRIIQVLLITFFFVAFFGILAIITVLVADKREEIALLKTLGLTPQQNFNSFLWTGFILGISASIVGSILGILLSINFNLLIKGIESIINSIQDIIAIFTQQTYRKFTFLNQSVYYLNKFPILIKSWDIVFISISAILCAIFAAIYPAYLSKKLKPAEILRKRAG